MVVAELGCPNHLTAEGKPSRTCGHDAKTAR
jgi:hypothetical protein